MEKRKYTYKIAKNTPKPIKNDHKLQKLPKNAKSTK